MSAEPTEAPAELLLSVPRSSFDLLEGAAEDKGRSRILNAVLLVLVVAVVGTLASRSVLTRLDASAARDDAAALTAESERIRAELAERRRNGEVSRKALDDHIAERVTLVEDITRTEMAYARIIREITALGPGITVSKIDFVGAGETSQGAAPAEVPPTTEATGTDADAPAPDPTANQPGITVSGTASDLSAATAAANALSDPSRFPYLDTGESGSVSCGTESGGSCTWSWNGKITDAGRANRTAMLVERTNAPTPGGG